MAVVVREGVCEPGDAVEVGGEVGVVVAAGQDAPDQIAVRVAGDEVVSRARWWY
ncbi:hypothetical protein ACH4VS_37145 [Streptomyces hygroscopicus]|uniref:hypothetical protein n=1 Tax=Streptomyces hygroscopicus TaxID=1912 RepID=UPI0037971F57